MSVNLLESSCLGFDGATFDVVPRGTSTVCSRLFQWHDIIQQNIQRRVVQHEELVAGVRKLDDKLRACERRSETVDVERRPVAMN